MKEPEEEVMGTLDLWLIGQKHMWPLGLVTGIRSGGSLVGLALNLSGLG